MGRSYTPTYRVEVREGRTPDGTERPPHKWGWDRSKGRPTPENLERYILGYGKSLELGGVNAHISQHLGYIPYPIGAKIVRQATGEVVAEWQAGAFQIW